MQQRSPAAMCTRVVQGGGHVCRSQSRPVRCAAQPRDADFFAAVGRIPWWRGGANCARYIVTRSLDTMSGFRGELAGPLAAVIIESAVDAIVVIDAAGRIEVFNPAAQRLFGYSESEVIGRNVSMLMPAPYRDEHDRYLQRYLEEGVARVIGIGREVQGLKRDGTLFPLHLSVAEMLVEGQRKFTGILHDLSARVELERSGGGRVTLQRARRSIGT